MPEESEAADMFRLASSLLCSAGYEHYESSSFALPGHRCTSTFCSTLCALLVLCEYFKIHVEVPAPGTLVVVVVDWLSWPTLHALTFTPLLPCVSADEEDSNVERQDATIPNLTRQPHGCGKRLCRGTGLDQQLIADRLLPRLQILVLVEFKPSHVMRLYVC